MGARAGDGTDGENGGTEDLARSNSSSSTRTSSSNNTCSNDTCSSSASSSTTWSSSTYSSSSSSSCMERPGVVIANSSGNRGGASLAVVAMVKAC